MGDIAAIFKSDETRKAYNALSEVQKIAYQARTNWLLQAHPHQIMPSGEWFSIWLMLAGRGAGKTRTAAEQIWWWAWETPKTRWLVAAPTSFDVRSTCFEGDSGLLSVIPPALIDDYNKALHEITLINGSMIKGIPASEPNRFRGPQFHGGWCCIPGTMVSTPDGDKKIESLCIGDIVTTRHGLRKVLAAGVSGNPNDLVRIDCGDTSLTVTIDHPILVGDQWIPAGEIKMGDKLWLATNTLMDDMRIESSMSGTMAQSQQGSSFTTGMRTRATTLLRTLRQCLSLSTNAITRQAKKTQWLNGKLPLKLLSHYAHPKMQSACIAKDRLFHSLPIRLGSFALAPALNNGGAINSSLSYESALFAKKTTQQSSGFKCTVASNVTPNQQQERTELSQLAVLSVERLPNSLTYNLTIEGEHEFIANGIVVHNCDELAAWEYLQEAWDMMQFGIRLGKKTKLICTTTPKPKELIVKLNDRDGEDVVVTRASTYVNLGNLSENFRKQILQYEGTTLGRQEIHAEIIDPEESGIVKRKWFKLWDADKPFPEFSYIVQSYDTAFTDRTNNDPTACTVWGIFRPSEDKGACVMLLDAWGDHLTYPDLKPRLLDEYESLYGEPGKKVDLMLIEDKGSGISLIQDLQRAGVMVRAYNPGRADKMQRLHMVANIIAAGRVYIPESMVNEGMPRDWAEPFINQICSFPESTHDDYVDSCTQALRLLRDMNFLNIDPPPPDTDMYIDERKPRRVNPYAV